MDYREKRTKKFNSQIEWNGANDGEREKENGSTNVIVAGSENHSHSVSIVVSPC